MEVISWSTKQQKHLVNVADLSAAVLPASALPWPAALLTADLSAAALLPVDLSAAALLPAGLSADALPAVDLSAADLSLLSPQSKPSEHQTQQEQIHPQISQCVFNELFLISMKSELLGSFGKFNGRSSNFSSPAQVLKAAHKYSFVAESIKFSALL